MMAHGAFEWKTVFKKSIYRPTQKKCSGEYAIIIKFMGYIMTHVLTHIKLRRLEWAGHNCRMDIKAPRERLEGKIHGSQPRGKPKDR